MTKVLIVETDFLTSNKLRNLFLVESCSVETAGSYSAARELLPVFQPDILFLDPALPEDGADHLIRELRADPSTRSLPVIVWASPSTASQVHKIMKAGGSYCLDRACWTKKDLFTLAAKAMSARSAASPENGAGIEERKASLRLLSQQFIKNPEKRMETIAALQDQLAGFSGSDSAGRPTFLNAFCKVFSSLLREGASADPQSAATFPRTVTQAIDLLIRLLESRPEDFPESRSLNVLVVDDDPIAAKVVEYTFQSASMQVTGLTDPTRVLSLLESQHFDIFILDINMPSIDGFELCSQIRSLNGYKTSPILFLTCRRDLESRALGRLKGGSDYVMKPFLPSELAATAMLQLAAGRNSSQPAEQAREPLYR